MIENLRLVFPSIEDFRIIYQSWRACQYQPLYLCIWFLEEEQWGRQKRSIPEGVFLNCSFFVTIHSVGFRYLEKDRKKEESRRKMRGNQEKGKKRGDTWKKLQWSNSWLHRLQENEGEMWFYVDEGCIWMEKGKKYFLGGNNGGFWETESENGLEIVESWGWK